MPLHQRVGRKFYYFLTPLNIGRCWCRIFCRMRMPNWSRRIAHADISNVTTTRSEFRCRRLRGRLENCKCGSCNRVRSLEAPLTEELVIDAFVCHSCIVEPEATSAVGLGLMSPTSNRATSNQSPCPVAARSPSSITRQVVVDGAGVSSRAGWSALTWACRRGAAWRTS